MATKLHLRDCRCCVDDEIKTYHLRRDV